MGLGFGFGLSSLLTLVPMVVSKQDIGKGYLPIGKVARLNTNIAVAMGAITQVRVLGGTVGLAIWYGIALLLQRCVLDQS